EVDAQGNRTLRSTEVLKEAVPEIVEIGTKEKVEQLVPSTDNSMVETPVKAEKAKNQLPNTGVETDASLVALGLLGAMSGYGLLARKKKED
ncbi:LPXTG cell wall anchor domain-containing protein, partial [Streptococcus oralis]